MFFSVNVSRLRVSNTIFFFFFLLTNKKFAQKKNNDKSIFSPNKLIHCISSLNYFFTKKKKYR
jgi:hypothetical protein